MKCPECNSENIRMHVRTQRIVRENGVFYIKLHKCEMCSCWITTYGKKYDNVSFEQIEFDKRNMFKY
jgi:transcriptional regulator NrdR family protein